MVTEFAYPFHAGGVEKRYYEIGRRLASRGHIVHWFAMQHWQSSEQAVSGIRLHKICKPVNVYAPNGNRSVQAGVKLSAAMVWALARTPARFDVIDCSLFPFMHIFGMRVIRPRTPLVVTWHEFWGDHWRDYLKSGGGIARRIERAAAEVPHRIVPISDMSRDALLREGVPRAKLSTVYNGVDLAAIGAIPARGEPYDLVSFGRLKNHKNVDILIRAVAELWRTGLKARCRIIGDGPEKGALQDLARNLLPPEAIVFTGAPTDERDLFGLVKTARVAVNPSTKEGGGSITVLEAYACGVPVVAILHPLGIDASLIRQGDTGWWAADATSAGLAAAIRTALSDSLSIAERAARCRDFARHYDWDRLAQQYEAVYAAAVFHA